MDYRTMVNPTYLTAKSTLHVLAAMGNTEAKDMMTALGTRDTLTRRNPKNPQTFLSEEDAKALMTGVSVAINARYEALSARMRKEGTKALLDIACGYTPRGLYCHRQGIDYVGMDVPLVAEELREMAKNRGVDITYADGDATNAASLIAAADNLNGKILISSEGLLSYLSPDEFDQFLDGVKQILKSHGGAWVSSDFSVDYEAFATACMSGEDAAERYQASRRQTMKTSNIYNEGVKNWHEDKMMSFLTARGFTVRKLPFADESDESLLSATLPESWKAAYRRLLDAASLWEITLNGKGVNPKIQGAKTADNLTIDHVIANGVLRCRVAGRIDTISAPVLLNIILANADGVQAVTIDADGLEYISSAGRRVLVMAEEKIGRVTVENARGAIKEILESNGLERLMP